MTMNKEKIKQDLVDLGREILAWAKPADVLSDREITEIFPRCIERAIVRLAAIRQDIQGEPAAHDLVSVWDEWCKPVYDAWREGTK